MSEGQSIFTQRGNPVWAQAECIQSTPLAKAGGYNPLTELNGIFKWTEQSFCSWQVHFFARDRLTSKCGATSRLNEIQQNEMAV